MDSDSEILRSFLEDLKVKLQQNITSVTGRSRESLEVVTMGSQAFLTGAPWLFALERGRGPRKSDEDWGMWKNIQEWLGAKGMDSSRSSAKSLTWWINKHGTQLYQSKQVSGILSDIIHPGIFDELANQLADKSVVLYMSGFLKNLNK